MKSVYKLFITFWILGFMAAVVTAPQPPIITKFLSEDLISPGDVPFQRSGSLKLPCAASGSNLSWTWKHNDTVISKFLGHPYSLSADGTLTGSYLTSEHSGTYQCFVKDQKTGIEVFSRKLHVAVTVVGKFSNTDDVEKKVNLGQPFSFQCPKHTDSFGATYQWVGNNNVQFSRNARRGISPNGDLHFLYVTQEDIDEINKNKGVRCTIQAANTLRKSGTLKLVKKSEGEKDPGNLRSPSWLVVPPKKMVAIEGQDTTLYCLATGRPAPRITWRKNGKKIVHGQNSYKILHKYYGRRLDINNLNKVKHQDRYTCEADNSQSNGKPLVHSINLVVEVPPRWTKTSPPKIMDLDRGGRGTLECHVTALPTAKITWYKNGRQLQTSNNEAHLKIDGNKLHLRDVNHLSDGVYQCAAENRRGMLASATWVHVQAPGTTGEATESEIDVYAAMMVPEAAEQRKERKKSNLGVILGASFVAVGVVIIVGFVLWKKRAKKMTSRERLLKELIDEMEGKWEEENPDRNQRERSKFWNFFSLKMRGGLEKICEVFQRKFGVKVPSNTAKENQRNLHDQICNQRNTATVGENNSHQRTQGILRELFQEKSHSNTQNNYEVLHGETSQMNAQGVQKKLHREKSCTDKQGYQIDLRQGKPHKDTKEDLESLGQKNSHHDLKKDQEDIRIEISRRDIQSHQKDIAQKGSHDLQNLQENMHQEGSHHDTQKGQKGINQKGSCRDQDTQEQPENICKEGSNHDILKHQKGSSQDIQNDQGEIRQEGSHHDIKILQKDLRKEISSQNIQERQEDMHQKGSNHEIQKHQKGSSQDLQQDREKVHQKGSHHDIQALQEEMRNENSSQYIQRKQDEIHQESSNHDIQKHQEVIHQKGSSGDLDIEKDLDEIRHEGSHHDIQILREDMRKESSRQIIKERQDEMHREDSNHDIQPLQEGMRKGSSNLDILKHQNGSSQDIKNDREEIRQEGSPENTQRNDDDVYKEGSSQDMHEVAGDIDQGNPHEGTQEDQ